MFADICKRCRRLTTVIASNRLAAGRYKDISQTATCPYSRSEYRHRSDFKGYQVTNRSIYQIIALPHLCNRTHSIDTNTTSTTLAQNVHLEWGKTPLPSVPWASRPTAYMARPALRSWNLPAAGRLKCHYRFFTIFRRYQDRV